MRRLVRSLCLTMLHICVITIASPCFGQDTGNFVVGRLQIGAVNYGKQQLPLLPETQNFSGDTANHPEQWEFAIQPLLMPAYDEHGKLQMLVKENWAVTKEAVLGGYKTSIVTRVGIPIILRNDRLTASAVAVLNDHYKSLNYSFKSTQVVTLPISSIEVKSDDFKSIPCTPTGVISVSGSQSEVYWWLDCTDAATGTSKRSGTTRSVDTLTQSLPFLDAKMKVNYLARAADVSVINLATRSVKQTSLYAKLNGAGGQTMLVTRDDLRKLALDSASEIYGESRGVVSERCGKDFVSDVLATFKDTQKLNAGEFTKEMLATTYKPEDVNPDEINKTLDKNISEDSTKDQVKLSGGAEAGFLGISAKGNMSGEYLKEQLAKRDIEAEFNGKKWVAKSVNVLRVNISTFTDSNRASCSDFSVGKDTPYASETHQLLFMADQWAAPRTEGAPVKP
jgi:hypothetical protein